jgi:hypothetical protein
MGEKHGGKEDPPSRRVFLSFRSKGTGEFRLVSPYLATQKNNFQVSLYNVCLSYSLQYASWALT